jgi:hypothetical protein
VETWAVPDAVLTHLLTGLADDTAHKMLRMQDPASRGLHPGDAYGLVLAWLWRESPSRVPDFVATLFAQLRKWDERASDSVGLESLLAGIQFSLQGLSPAEVAALVERARREVPELYGGDEEPRL